MRDGSRISTFQFSGGPVGPTQIPEDCELFQVFTDSLAPVAIFVLYGTAKVPIASVTSAAASGLLINPGRDGRVQFENGAIGSNVVLVFSNRFRPADK